jgi:hypothetical protein
MSLIHIAVLSLSSNHSSSAPGWAYCTGTGRKHNSNDGTSYGQRCHQGDIIRTRLDLDRGTLEWFRNGASLGRGFDNMLGPLRPALSLVNRQTATLRVLPPAGSIVAPS